MAGKGGGYSSGAILFRDGFELTYMYDGMPYSIALDTLERG